MNLKSCNLQQISLLLMLTLSFFLCLNNLAAQNAPVSGASRLQVHYRGKTRPLRELAPMPGTNPEKRNAKKANKPKFTPPNFINWRRQPHEKSDALPIGADPVRQDNLPRNLLTPTEPTLVLEGINENQGDAGVPDTNGDVSPDHYFQIVNASWFRIWDKEGNPLTPVTSANTIWSEIGQQSFSDPVVVWDEDAGRWLLTDLADIDVVLYGVSETADPLGAWFLYTFNTPDFADYPKYGVWPGAYVLTVNAGGGSYPVYAINRQQMLAGASSVDVQRIEIPAINGGFPTATPMDWNSPSPPPGDEVYVVRMNDDAWDNGNDSDQIEVWGITIDWENADNTTASPTNIPTAPFDSDGCSVGGGFSFECIPQPGTTQGIDGIMTIIMNNVAYWNYGTHESAVLTFSVNAGGDVAGIRWMELRREPGGEWELFQEGTFAPDDGVHRFIGGVSINGKGDIGLAYSVSGENTFPGLRFTGRRAGDPLGEMTIDEYEFATGAGVRDGIDRYGDYARMTVDPTDGSFWFTSEYVKADGSFGTKIVNFSLGRDSLDIAPVALDAPQNASGLTANEPVTITVRNIGLNPASNITVGYIFENGAPVVEPAAIDTLMPDSSYVHTFGTTVDMLQLGQYEFKVFATFPEDQNTPNDTLRRVRRTLPRYDAGITNIAGLDGILCDSVVTAELKLVNFGTETLNTVSIQYQLNGGPVQTEDWSGDLASGATTTVSLNLSGIANGVNTLNVSTSDPNGEADEIPSNDATGRQFQVLLDGVGVTLELTFDYFSEETSWQVEDANGQILFSGDDYYDMPEETITELWCLKEDSCYTFRIFDSYGDGLTNDFGISGSYEIKDAEGNVLASVINPNFGFEEVNEFCVSLPCALAADIDVTPASGAGSNDGAILVSVTAGISPFSYSLNGGEAQVSPLFSGLTAGVYTVNVTDANGCVLVQQITVSTVVSTSNLSNDLSIVVFPNPSPQGAFRVKVAGLLDGSPQLDMQVVDALGRPVIYETLAAIDNYHEGLISLRNYPAGVYYIRFKNEKISELVKIIRL